MTPIEFSDRKLADDVRAAFTAFWGFGRSDEDGSLEQSCWDDGLAAFTAGAIFWRERTSLPTPAPGQCPMCGEYSMAARAHQGLYGAKVEL